MRPTFTLVVLLLLPLYAEAFLGDLAGGFRAVRNTANGFLSDAKGLLGLRVNPYQAAFRRLPALKTSEQDLDWVRKGHGETLRVWAKDPQKAVPGQMAVKGYEVPPQYWSAERQRAVASQMANEDNVIMNLFYHDGDRSSNWLRGRIGAWLGDPQSKSPPPKPFMIKSPHLAFVRQDLLNIRDKPLQKEIDAHLLVDDLTRTLGKAKANIDRELAFHEALLRYMRRGEVVRSPRFGGIPTRKMQTDIGFGTRRIKLDLSAENQRLNDAQIERLAEVVQTRREELAKMSDLYFKALQKVETDLGIDLTTRTKRFRLKMWTEPGLQRDEVERLKEVMKATPSTSPVPVSQPAVSLDADERTRASPQLAHTVRRRRL